MKPKRTLSFLLAMVMVLFLLPVNLVSVSATETTEATEKNITLGTSALKGGQQSNIYFGNYQQSSLGKAKPATGTEGVDWVRITVPPQHSQGPYYSKDPIKWRVLDVDTTNSTAFLLSDKNLDLVHYHEKFEPVTWEKSTMRSWLNGYGTSSNQSSVDYSSTNEAGNDNFIDSAFSESEQKHITNTTVVNADNPSYNTEGGNNTTDKIFLLSIAEAKNTGYGFTDNTLETDTRKSVNTAYVRGGGHTGTGGNDVGSADCWWLRSCVDTTDAPFVNTDGSINGYGFPASLGNNAVRPAFNLNLSSVLFTSAAKGGKSSTAAGGGAAISKNADFSSISDNDGYKLTLKDSNRSFSVSDTGEKTVFSGETLSIGYSGAETGTNEYISAMITDNSGNVLYYGQLAQPTTASGTVDFVVPSHIGGTYTLKLFNEQINGDYKTDYASAFVDIALTVEERCKFTNGVCTCGELEPATLDGDIYKIGNAGQLLWFAEQVNSGNSTISGKLTADIDLESREWTPIGYYKTDEDYLAYSGTFNGQNFAVTGLKVNASRSGSGLFGYSTGTVQNIKVSGDIIVSENELSCIGVVGSASGTVSGITSHIKITVAEGINKSAYIGGVVGRLFGNVSKCLWDGNIDIGITYVDQTGGIVGYTNWTGITSITDCVSYGTITSSYTDSLSIGGIMGYARNENFTMKNCLFAGEINCTAMGENTGNVTAVCYLNDKVQNRKVSNVYYLKDSAPNVAAGDNKETVIAGSTAVTTEQLKNGEVACELGDAFGQTIGTDKLPVLNGKKVYKYNESNVIYSNDVIDTGEFAILSHYESDEKATATVCIPTEGKYTLIFAKYDGEQFKDCKFVTVNADGEDKIITVSAKTDIKLSENDKIFLWKNLETLTPMCEEYTVTTK